MMWPGTCENGSLGNLKLYKGRFHGSPARGGLCVSLGGKGQQLHVVGTSRVCAQCFGCV